jgi:hypothetical protein
VILEVACEEATLAEECVAAEGEICDGVEVACEEGEEAGEG